MHWFDLRQQFGVPGVVLAALGASYILVRWPKRGLLLLLAYGANLVFAWTYNVGDVYIFFLPSHYVLALCAGAGVAALMWLVARTSNRALATTAGMLCLLYPSWRAYDTFPAVDRSGDHRAVELLDQFTAPPRPRDIVPAPREAIYGANTNWQIQNAFEYFVREHKPGTPWFLTEELQWLEQGNVAEGLETFIRANHEIGREVLVAPGVYSRFQGPEAALETHGQDIFSERVLSVPAGTPYALAMLLPDREYPLDRLALSRSWNWLTGGATGLPPLRRYTVVAGRVGQPPTLTKSEDRPYRTHAAIGPFRFEVRMESWLPTDTIRRAGFGHVIVDRKHVLTIERGISFVALVPGGTAAYASGQIAPIPRYTLGRP
jgi:hypothetical protein